MSILKFLSSLFIEKKCYWCQQSGHFFCRKCRGSITIYNPYCYVCKETSIDFFVHDNCNKNTLLSQIIVLTRYRQKWIKKLLRHAKYYWKYDVYKDLIIPNTDFFNKYIKNKNSVFIPVPMHFLRKWKRWYNQSQIIAEILWRECHIPVKNNFLKRSRHTKQQSHLSSLERTKNLSWAFALNKIIDDKKTTIYLIDDVVSTWSTLHEIATLFHENWYKDIRAIALASD